MLRYMCPDTPLFRPGYALTLSDSLTWSDLWSPVAFFTEYKYYVTVKAIAGSPADRVAYEGLVESSVRQLVLSLQNEPDVAFAIPFPKASLLVRGGLSLLSLLSVT